MSKLDVQEARRQALAVVFSQGLLGLIVAAICLAIGGTRAGASALLGAAIGVAATTLMAFAMLRHGEGATLARATVGFFLGWLVKVGFTVALLVVAFRSPGVSPVPMLAAYVATFVGYWMGAVRTGGRAHEQ